MAVPTVITDLSATASSNSPAGGDAIGTTLDDFLRAHAAFIRQLYDVTVIWGGTAGGTANAITLSPSLAPSSYTTPLIINFIADATNTGAVTVNVSSLGTKNVTKRGALALVANDIVQGNAYTIAYDGTQFQLINPPANSQGASVAAASTLDLTAVTGDLIDITGNTGISAVTLPQGRRVRGRFTGTPTLTHGASLVLNGGGQNIVAAAGDYIDLMGYASGVVRGIFHRANANLFPPITRGTPVNSTSGTSVDFTGLPSGVNRIEIILEAVSTSGTSVPIVQLGTSSGIETNNYFGSVSNIPNGSSPTGGNHTTGFHLSSTGWAGTIVITGHLTLIRYDGNAWSIGGTLGRFDNAASIMLGGVKGLSNILDRVRITTAGGSDTFDAGRIQINYA